MRAMLIPEKEILRSSSFSATGREFRLLESEMVNCIPPKDKSSEALKDGAGELMAWGTEKVVVVNGDEKGEFSAER